MVWNGLCQFSEHVRNGFASVKFVFCMIEFCDLVYPTLRDHRDFRNIFCFQHGAHGSFIGIQDSVNKGLAVHVAAVFCSKHISVVVLSYLDQQRHFSHIQGKVVTSGNGVSDWIIVTELCLVCKCKIRIQPIFCTDIGKWENIVCHGGQHLLGKLCHIRLYGGLRVEFAINRKGFYQHADCVFKPGIVSSIINRGKQTILCIGVFCHKDAEQTCK